MEFRSYVRERLPALKVVREEEIVEEVSRRRREETQATGTPVLPRVELPAEARALPLLEFRDHMVFYSYAIAGVEYSACQDLADLQRMLPPDLWTTIGPATMKYDPRNPANSIVLCEQWSGLRSAHRVE